MLFLSFLNKESINLFLSWKLKRTLNSEVKATIKMSRAMYNNVFSTKTFQNNHNKTFLDKIKLTKTNI